MSEPSPTTQVKSRRPRLRSVSSRLRQIPTVLVLLLAVGALQSLAWAIALPAFQGPDEDAHYAYVQHVAETGELPSPTGGAHSDSTEQEEAMNSFGLFALRGDLGARPRWGAADLSFWHELERRLPATAKSDGAGPNPIAKNPPLYYALMSVPYRLLGWLPVLKRVFVLRLFNALCFLVTIAVTFLLAGELFGPVRWKQVVAAGAVALEPQLAFMSAVINADNLLIALTSTGLLVALRLVTRGPSMGRVFAASLVTAAAILTHGRGLVMLPILATGLFAAWFRHRPAAREALHRAAVALATLGGAVIAYFAFGRAAGSSSLYGGQVSQINSGTSFNLRQFITSIYQFYFPRLRSMQPRVGPEYGYKQVFIDTFYGTFGWLEIQFKERIYDVLQILSGIGLLGLFATVVARRARLLAAWPVVVVPLSLLVTNLFFLHYVSYRALLSNGGSDPLIVGRYLLPMVSLFGLAIAFTLGALPRRLGPYAGALVLALGALLSLAGLGITVTRFYA